MSELPPGWASACLGDLCHPSQYGWTTSATAERTDGLRFLRTTDITKGQINWRTVPYCAEEPSDASRYLLASGDIVISRAGSVGFSTYLDHVEPSIFASYLIRFRPLEGMNGRYLAWFLKGPSYWAQIRKASSGITLANVNAKKLSAVNVPVAPIAEQDRIVAAIEEQFSRLDAGVAALERAQQNLQRMRAAVLNGLLAAEDGTEFPQIALGDVLMRGRYGTSTKCSVNGAGLPVLRIPNVESGNISLSDMKYAVDLSVDLTGSLAIEGDILIIRTNGSRSLIGRAAVVPQFPYPVAFASYLIKLRLDNAAVNPAYVVAALTAPSLRARIEELAATTAGQYNISLDKLRSLRIPLPSLPQQNQLLLRAEGLLSVADHIDGDIRRALERASQLRASILARAFVGDLVTQDSADEPASALLERVAAERASSNGHRSARTGKPRASRDGVKA